MSTQIALPEAEELSLSAAPVVTSPAIALPREERAAAMPKLGRKHQHGMNWFTTIFMIIFHAGAIAALFFFTWKALICALVLWVLATNVGIGMSYHRLLTHRGYRVPKWLEYSLAICGTLALEGGPIFWVATHRLHHQNSDHEGDPHTPHEGGWWAHAGWILSATRSAAKPLPRPLRTRPHARPLHGLAQHIPLGPLSSRRRSRLPRHRRMARRSLGHLPARRPSASTPPGWSTPPRTCGARAASRPSDDSRNNWWVALVTGGEGWHNNHHAHPVSARHGLRWYEFDINYYGIWLLEKLGLAREIKTAQWDPGNPRPAGTA